VFCLDKTPFNLFSGLVKQLAPFMIFSTLFMFCGYAFAEDKAETCDTMDYHEKEAICTEVKVESGNPVSGNCEAIVRGGCRYFKWCAACHGVKADGVSRFEKFAADLTKHWRGYGGFIEIVLNGSEGNLGRMPPWKGVLNFDQINQIGAYLETLADEKKAYWK
jgi:cytochrome c5